MEFPDIWKLDIFQDDQYIYLIIFIKQNASVICQAFYYNTEWFAKNHSDSLGRFSSLCVKVEITCLLIIMVVS